MKDLLPTTIKDTQKRLLKGELTAVKLVDLYLARIKRYDKNINSFLTLSEESAYKQAKIVDQLINDFGKEALVDHPLLGVVTAHKDLFLTKGIRTTAGSKVLEGYIPTYSATVVRKLENAGCITIGKLNCDAWAHGSSGENSDFGATKNPWDVSRVPGGSSSGSGAALAANFALLSTGTDTCGSIRLPANFCGVVGFKPTYGSVSRYGVVAMASSLDSIGHLTRNVEDSESVFNLTKGKDGHDGTLASKPNKKKNEKLRIGVPKEFFGGGVSEEIKKSVLNSAKIFEKQGVSLVDISLPSTKHAVSVYYIVQPAEVSSNLARYDGVRFGNDRNAFGSEAKRRIMLGAYVLSKGYYDAYYLKAQKVRTKIIQELDGVFDKVEAIITPVSPTTAFKLGEKTSDPLKMYLTDIFAATANLSGIPAISIPSGLSKNGLPMGFQLMAPRFSENTLFSLGKLFEKEARTMPLIAKLT